MPIQSQSEINAFFCLIAQRAAASPKAGVADAEFKSLSEIRSEIRTSNPELLTLLDNFIDAYKIWYAVHVEIEESGAAGCLIPEQQTKLQESIAARDNTRRQLLNAIAT